MPLYFTCSQCEAPFRLFPSELRKRPGPFCSIACRVESGVDRRPTADRFWEKVDRSGDCWTWTASLQAGYGQAFAWEFHRKRPMPAHRVAWFLATGHIPGPGETVLHTCDNRACVRNDQEGWYRVGSVLLPRHGHLALGRPIHNSRDMTAKGRGSTRPVPAEKVPRGERNGQARLTEREVVAIRALSEDGLSHAKLAARFGISPSHISGIVNRRFWQHVE